MKLFLSTDFEGTSGIVAWEQIIEGNSEYEQGRLLLTNEVNAVISGALEAGATEFVVNDSHHFMRNLHPQDLLGQAMLITGDIVGESAINALVATHYNVPIIFISGDRVQEAHNSAPNAEKVVVKQSLGRFAAAHIHPTVACEMLKRGASRAISNLKSLSR